MLDVDVDRYIDIDVRHRQRH